MAYPSGVSFKHTSNVIGLQGIHEVSTTQKHPLGMVVTAKDVTYGEGEFIYLIGVASTAQGDLVAYNSKTGATTRATAGGTGCQGPVAVAAADLIASRYGWYQISGSAPVKSGTVAANTSAYLTSTAGQVDDAADYGDGIRNFAIKAADSSGYAACQFNRPSVTAESVQATLEGFYYATLSAAAESGNAIVVTGQVKTLDGTNVAAAHQVVVRTLAVTADKGDITVTAGTEIKTVNPATGENVSWIETTAAGAFAVSVANDVAEATLISATPDNGITQKLVLDFSLV